MEKSVKRRTFLKRGAATVAGLSAASLIQACGSTGAASSKGGNLGPGGLPLARPNQPVKLPIYSGNQPVASGKSVEKGPLQIYMSPDYLNPAVIKDFEKLYRVSVQSTPYETMTEAIAKIASGGAQFDLLVPEPFYLEQLVVGKLLQPLNLSYLPNLKQNVWTALVSPWYDVGSRYTVPYTVYTTGIGWRSDKLPGFNPAKLANPWDALWRIGPKISGLVGILDDQRYGMVLGLLRDGVIDVNSEDSRQLTAAQNALISLVKKTNLKIDTNYYQGIADGTIWLHQAWSGDMALAPSFAPAGTSGSVLQYWWPADGRGPVEIDPWAVVHGAQNPVLAHHFMNYLLDTTVAFKNFNYTGYQQPIHAMTPEAMIERKVIPPNLRDTLIHEAQFTNGLGVGALSENGQLLWQNAWAAVKSA